MKKFKEKNHVMNQKYAASIAYYSIALLYYIYDIFLYYTIVILYIHYITCIITLYTPRGAG